MECQLSKFKDIMIVGFVIVGVGNWLANDGDSKHKPDVRSSSNNISSSSQPVPPKPELARKQIDHSVVASVPKNKSKPLPKIDEPVWQDRYVDASRLNVRQSPGKGGKVIWTLKRDQKVTVVRTDGDWSLLRSERFTGWVFSSFLSLKPAPAKAVTSKRTHPKKLKKKRTKISTSKIKRILMKRSIARYSGNCPCPYNRDRAGRKCGRRSAWSRPGGASPLCYARDVTVAMVTNYRVRN